MEKRKPERRDRTAAHRPAVGGRKRAVLGAIQKTGISVSTGPRFRDSFVAELPRIVREYEACIALIKPKVDKESIFAMSDTTLDRDKGPEGTVRATERESALPTGRPKTEAHTQAAGVLAGPAAADGVYLAMR